MQLFKDFFNQNKIEYRNVSNNDIDEILSLCQNEPEFNSIVSKNEIKEYIIDSVNFKKSLVALNKDKIIGILLISPDDHTNKKTIREIVILWVHPDLRKRGIGEQLVRNVESSSRNNGIDLLTIQVYKQLKTHDFWKNIGYKLYNIYSEDNTEVFMYRKNL